MSKEPEAPKSPMTIHKWVEILHLENDRKHNEMMEQINTLSDKMKKEFVELKLELTAAIEEIKLYQSEIISPIEEIEQLKEENASLRNKIQYLWELFTSFFGLNFFVRHKNELTESIDSEHSNSCNF